MLGADCTTSPPGPPPGLFRPEEKQLEGNWSCVWEALEVDAGRDRHENRETDRASDTWAELKTSALGPAE